MGIAFLLFAASDMITGALESTDVGIGAELPGHVNRP